MAKLKPAIPVVMQDTKHGKYRMGQSGWTEDLQRARVWRSEGMAKRSEPGYCEVRYVPVKMVLA